MAKRICTKMRLYLSGEKTKARILDTVLLASEIPTDRDKEWCTRLDRFKAVLEPMAHSKSTSKHMTVFLRNPQDLEEDHYASLYPETGPVFREFYELGPKTTHYRWRCYFFKAAAAASTSAQLPVPMKVEKEDMSACAPSPERIEPFCVLSKILGQCANPMAVVTAMVQVASDPNRNQQQHPTQQSQKTTRAAEATPIADATPALAQYTSAQGSAQGETELAQETPAHGETHHRLQRTLTRQCVLL